MAMSLNKLEFTAGPYINRRETVQELITSLSHLYIDPGISARGEDLTGQVKNSSSMTLMGAKCDFHSACNLHLPPGNRIADLQWVSCAKAGVFGRAGTRINEALQRRDTQLRAQLNALPQAMSTPSPVLSTAPTPSSLTGNSASPTSFKAYVKLELFHGFRVAWWRFSQFYRVMRRIPDNPWWRMDTMDGGEMGGKDMGGI